MGCNGMTVRQPNGEWLLLKKEFSTVDMVEGIKVVRKDGFDMAKLPLHSMKSSAYIAISQEGKLTQIRVFKDHNPLIDIDLGHSHHHNVGDIHVHDYDLTNPGEPKRARKARPLSDEESKLYGEILTAMKGYKK